MVKKENAADNGNYAIYQHEDAALKTSMQFFAEEMLPYLGIEGKVKAIAPGELVYLELKKMYQDFNLVMEDGSWKHFEFQSTDEGIEGLKRFRTYEALTSYQHKVDVTTYVMFSGKIQKPVTEFVSGLNTYRIYPIILQQDDGGKVIKSLQEKMESGEILTKKDLVPLTLCLLMGGEMSQKDRVRSAFAITQKADRAEPQTIRKIEAVIYTMAEKFLETDDMKEIMEEVRMTRLGQMLVEDGMKRGIEQGLEQGLERAKQIKIDIARSFIGLLDVNVIAERVGLPVEKVLELKKETEN